MLIVAATLLIAVPPAMMLAVFLYMQHNDLPGGYFLHTNLIYFPLWLGLSLGSLAWSIRLVSKQ